jgi:drug/metabolite transporter (DMT)-like permease
MSAQRPPRIPAMPHLPAPVIGALWVVASSLGFAVFNLISRVLVDELPPLVVVFVRNLSAFLFTWPWIWHYGFAALRTRHFGLYLSRSSIAFFSMACWFTGLAMMPLATAAALSFTAPLWATMAAVIVLGETVRARRWTATIIGFLGAMIVLRPGIEVIGLGPLLLLASAALGGVNATLVKHLTRTESAGAIVIYMTMLLTPMSLIPALFVWETPGWHLVPWILLLGFLGTASHFCLVRGFAVADASLVMPFEFVRLPFVALGAWFAFGEVPDVWTIVGAGVIFGSAAYIAQREATLARRARSAAPAGGAAAASETAGIATRADPRP